MGKYNWDYSKGKVPQISQHSITKHEVISKYVETYLRIVGGHYYSEQLSINIVDGFSGGGLYEKGDGSDHFGSPIIFLKRVQEAEIYLNETKKQGFEIYPRFYFVEEDLQTKNFLEQYIKNDLTTTYQIGEEIFIRRSDIGSIYKDIITDIKKRKGRAHRTIFLLDQYGYSAVPINFINYIFQELPNAEIILTFNVDSMITYLSDTGTSKPMLRNIGLDFGLDKIREIKTKRRWKRLIQFALFDSLRDNINSKHVSNLFIKSSDSSHSYWLLHFSMTEKAKNEMEKIHWSYRNHFVSQTSKGLRVFSGYDPSKDLEHTGQEEFSFDYADKIESEEQLFLQIPQYLTNEKISAHNFFLNEMDDTPATKEMIYKVIKKLYRLKQIKITTKAGTKKQPDAELNDDDLIFKENQLRFKFSNLRF